LYAVAGTHNTSDVLTDVALGAGFLKSTGRYKEADRTLKKAKSKYAGASTTITGHSLGGSISSGIAKKEDKVYNLDAGYTIGQRTKKSQTNLRTSGDVVSLLGSGNKHMKTLKNPKSIKNMLIGGALSLVNPVLCIGYGALQSHDVNNIKNEKLYV